MKKVYSVLGNTHLSNTYKKATLEVKKQNSKGKGSKRQKQNS